MKKISIIGALAFLPIASFASENIQEQNKFNPRFFVEYGVSLYSNSSTDYEIEGEKVGEADASTFNGGGMAYIGVDFDGVQIGFAPEYSDSDTEEILALNVRAVVPFMDNDIQPYVMAELGFASMEYNDGSIKFDDTAFAYGIGAGIKYNFNDNMNIKAGIEYQSMSFETNLNGYEYSVDTSGFMLTTSIGYRF